MNVQEAVAKLVDGQGLSEPEAEAVMNELMTGQGTPSQMAGLLVALRMKGETVDELTGFARSMRKHATFVKTHRRPLVDTCGTGGDHSGTFNISTAAAFVVAGAGVAVAKHGNRSASSRCGSADVLEALGVNLNLSAERVGQCIDEIGIGFLFARLLHGAMKHVAPIRAELKIRTVFNLLGPLTNPAGACGQVLGVFDVNRVLQMAQVLAKLGTRRAFVVAGRDGLDEISLSGPTVVAEARETEITIYELTPEEAGLSRAPREALKGGDAETNARILRAVLEGEEGPARDVVCLNAAAGILAGDAADDWRSAIQAARASIDSGRAKGKLEALAAFTRDGLEPVRA